MISNRSSTRQCLAFSKISLPVLKSTATACAAPRLKASIATAPVPENISSTSEPNIPLFANTLNTLSRTRSSVGLVSNPLGDFITCPLAVPPIIRIQPSQDYTH